MRGRRGTPHPTFLPGIPPPSISGTKGYRLSEPSRGVVFFAITFRSASVIPPFRNLLTASSPWIFRKVFAHSAPSSTCGATPTSSTIAGFSNAGCFRTNVPTTAATFAASPYPGISAARFSPVPTRSPREIVAAMSRISPMTMTPLATQLPR